MKKEKPETDTRIKSEKQQEDPAIERGRKAIIAARMVNPQPEDEQERLEKEDAEKWRNEG